MRKPALCLVFVAACAVYARPAGQEPIPNPMNRQSRNPFDGFGDVDSAMAARRMRALNVERQKSVVSDTDKLLKLAKELNKEIENSNPVALTPVQLRKISDIEKLARSVKQKMSASFTGGPTPEEPGPRQFP